MKIRYIVIVFIICVVLVSSTYLSLKPALDYNAKSQMNQFVTLIINRVSVDVDYQKKNLVDIQYNHNKKATMIDFKMQYINYIASLYVHSIEKLFLEIESGRYQRQDNDIYNTKLNEISCHQGVVARVPLSQLLSLPIVFGPYIKIKYNTISKISSNIDKKIKRYGINHISIMIDLVVYIELLYQYPLYGGKYYKNYHIPLLFEVVEGDVPDWYTSEKS